MRRLDRRSPVLRACRWTVLVASVALGPGLQSDEPPTTGGDQQAKPSRDAKEKAGDVKAREGEEKEKKEKEKEKKEKKEKNGAPGGDHEKKGRKPNRLGKEKSPYLLQHAYNPVDWYPWGEEAFAKARKEDKPIFLSIGYSTCHWCHVMERESFEDEEIAKYLNEHFVCIKVDREERPDVDAIYMDAVQAMRQRGGWPLSAFLTTDGNPFFGGTYFPPQRFLELLKQVDEAWTSQRDGLEEQGEKIAEHLRQAASRLTQGELTDSLPRTAFDYYEQAHDAEYGGFGRAPKFPRTSNLDFLMRYARRTHDEDALRMVYTTLDNMIRGGIRDHLGGGFHRYSTDRVWLVPHFEKMLYDNALIARTLVDAYRISGRQDYIDVARETLDYLIGRMQGPEGGFFSAEDADTEGREGLTYVWKRAEIVEVLGKERAEVFADFYGVGEKGNFVEPRSQEESHESIIHVTLKGGEEELAAKLGKPREEVRRQLAEDRARLLEVRHKRPQPFLDDKVLTEWNGLAISAFSHAYQVTGDERYLKAARRAADFILRRMVTDGQLHRRYRGGAVAIRGFLTDHAFLVEGLLDLYEADFDKRWLEEAVRLGKAMVTHFWDEKDGAFHSSASHHEKLITRSKKFYDGAVPSGNSVAFLDLLRLQEFTGDKVFEGPVEKFKGIAAGLLARAAHLHPQLLCGVEYILQQPLEIVVVGESSEPLTRSMIREVRRRFLPAKILLHVPDGKAANALANLAPVLEYKTAIGGKATTFVCRQRVCKLPARDLETLRKQLDEALKFGGE